LKALNGKPKIIEALKESQRKVRKLIAIKLRKSKGG
jgi:hypothetical protein